MPASLPIAFSGVPMIRQHPPLAERTIVVVCSFIPDSSFLSHGRNAQALWDPIIADIAEYPRPLPIIVTSKPLHRWGKAPCLRHLRNQLWHQQQASFDSWVHVDDRLDIVREIDAERGLRGVHWDIRDRRTLLELCRAEGVLSKGKCKRTPHWDWVLLAVYVKTLF